VPNLNYYRRVAGAYFTKRKSQLSFWHNEPKVNENFTFDRVGEYYMPFIEKALYEGPFDENNIPVLDYHGKIGKQYNPIAIAQYGLGNFNLYKRTGEKRYRITFFNIADWLVQHLEQNEHGLWIWNHYFDFEYQSLLKAPWCSALAQGQGISVLIRAYLESGDEKYKIAAQKAFESFNRDIDNGGVMVIDAGGDLWFEEYIVNPPTHILNGFIWALWGIYDYHLCFKDKVSLQKYDEALKTIKNNLHRYDTGFWSLYDLSQNKIKNIASPFYHKLHIVQLLVLYKITGEKVFKEFANKWGEYFKNPSYRKFALLNKGLFKFFYH
jgi:hypothetical protein